MRCFAQAVQDVAQCRVCANNPGCSSRAAPHSCECVHEWAHRLRGSVFMFSSRACPCLQVKGRRLDGDQKGVRTRAQVQAAGGEKFNMVPAPLKILALMADLLADVQVGVRVWVWVRVWVCVCVGGRMRECVCAWCVCVTTRGCLKGEGNMCLCCACAQGGL